VENSKVDIQTLALVVERCFDLSMDDRLRPAQRSRFLILAKRLRGSLLNLISARFEEDTQGLLAANEGLEDLSERLRDKAGELAQVSRTLADLGKLVGSLDRLLGAAASFL
jgi:hypothetical protein